jgi:2-dehydro-3-deoxyglucarate aldolase
MPFKTKSLAAWQQLPSIQSTIAMAQLGYDWIIVDLEHTTITTNEAESIFIAAERHGCKPFVRLPSADPYLARRLLDAGCQGILVPVVEDRKSFDKFAEHCFFPPHGKRGLGLVRANEWGKKLQEYYKTFSPIIIAQIETKTGSENIDTILESKFLDGIMIGPYDLSASLGIPGQFDDKNFVDICKKITDKTKLSGKLVGYHQVEPELNLLNARKKEGYDFIAYGTDVVALRYALQGVKK